MVFPQPSPRIRELIRETARIALNPGPEWLDEFDRATLAAKPTIAADPALATIVSRANRANLLHFALANLRNPGAPVPPNLGVEPLRMARHLVRRDLDALAPDVYRIGQNVAWRRWTDIAFGQTSDPQELHELLDVSKMQSANCAHALISARGGPRALSTDSRTNPQGSLDRAQPRPGMAR